MIFNFVFQGNTSTIKLSENEKLSSVKRTRHFDVRLFHVTDFISRKEVTIKHCPTGKMLADCFSKLLVGKLFHMMRIDVVSIELRYHAGRLGKRVIVAREKLTLDF